MLACHAGMEARRPRVPGHPELHRELKSNLVYMRPYIKKKKVWVVVCGSGGVWFSGRAPASCSWGPGFDPHFYKRSRLFQEACSLALLLSSNLTDLV